MKTKTAIITIYQMYGASAYACDVGYRGKFLTAVQNSDRYECSKLAFYWAKQNGFTHAKLVGVEKPYTVVLEGL